MGIIVDPGSTLAMSISDGESITVSTRETAILGVVSGMGLEPNQVIAKISKSKQTFGPYLQGRYYVTAIGDKAISENSVVDTVESFPPAPKNNLAESIMWLGDSITQRGCHMPHTPNGRATRELTVSLANINSAGNFIISIEASALCPAGNGTLRFYAADSSMSWQALGDTEGPRVAVPIAGFYTLESGTADKQIYISAIPRTKPTTDKTDTVNIIGQFRWQNNTGTSGLVNWAQALLPSQFAKSLCYGISSIRASDWIEARAQWQNVYTDITHIFLGTNDVNSRATALQALADIEAMVVLRMDIGSRVILGTLMPYDARTADQNKAVAEFNMGIRSMAAKYYIDVADYWTFLANPTTGKFYPGDSRDGLHVSGLGGYKVAKRVLVPILSKYITKNDTRIYAPGTYDATLAPYGNLLTNGALTGTVAAASTGITGEVPTSWTCIRESGSNITAVAKAPDSAGSVQRTDGRPGGYATFTVSNAGGVDGEGIRFRPSATITTGFSAGDWIMIEGDLQVSGTNMQWIEVIGYSGGGVATRNSVALTCNQDAIGAIGDLGGDTVTIPWKSAPMQIEVGDTFVHAAIIIGMKSGGTATLSIGQTVNLHKVDKPSAT